MEIKKQGQILELDPNKKYLMFIKAHTLLAKAAKQGLLKIKDGNIYFVGSLDEFRFVENSDRITEITFEEGIDVN